jgi:hypothetical protein
MIFYHIQVHERFDYLIRLIGYIYDPANFYFIAVDAAVPEMERRQLDHLRGCRNIVVSANASISWLGISSVNSLVLGMRAFLASDPRHQYFINISGVDLPLKTQPEIRAVLAQFDVNTPSVWTLSSSCPAEYFVEDIGGTDFEAFKPRSYVEFVADPQVAFVVDDPKENAILRPERRVGVMALELSGEKRHIVRPLLSLEYRARTALLEKTGYRIGRAWHIFNRAFTERVLQSDQFYILAHLLTGMINPDECIFQTVIPHLAGIVHYNENYRWEYGAPVLVHDGLLAGLAESSAFFARKLHFDDCERLLAWADTKYQGSRNLFEEESGAGCWTGFSTGPFIDECAGRAAWVVRSRDGFRIGSDGGCGHAFIGWRMAVRNAVRLVFSRLDCPRRPLAADANPFLGFILDFRRRDGGRFRVALCDRELVGAYSRNSSEPGWGKAAAVDVVHDLHLSFDNVVDLSRFAPADCVGEAIVSFGAQDLQPGFCAEASVGWVERSKFNAARASSSGTASVGGNPIDNKQPTAMRLQSVATAADSVITGAPAQLPESDTRLATVEAKVAEIAAQIEAIRDQLAQATATLDIVKHGTETWLLPTLARHSAALARRGRWRRALHACVRAVTRR